jgi:uncharacterized protein (TIGR03083 family)
MRRGIRPSGRDPVSAVVWTDASYLVQTDGMASPRLDTREEVRRIRLEIADEIAALSPDQWETASWCAGWRVRDVLGHLVQTGEATLPSMFWQIIRNGVRPDRAIRRIARDFGDQPVPVLVERLRVADGGLRIPGIPPEVGLGDVLVHSADALRPVGIMPDPPLADVIVVLDTYVKWGRRLVHAVPHRAVTLAATDSNWRRGSGPEVRGRAIDLLLLMANRRQVVERLEGPGIAQLAL